MQIIIIGAGQLGSRHLQGLCTPQKKIFVDVVDPSEASLETCKARFEEVAHTEIKATFMQTLPQNKSYDVAIIATNSRIRASVTEDFISNNSVKYIVFEKVLFTKIDDYAHIQEVLSKYNIQAWVNCPRRMYPIFQKLLPLLQNSRSLNFVIQGGDWGLGCNSIHFIDIVSYLSAELQFKYNNMLLDCDIRDSKRASYKEFTGSLLAQGENGSSIMLTSRKDSNAICSMQIMGDDIHAIVNEAHGLCTLYTANNQWQAQEIHFTTPYQSQLTGILIDQLQQTGTCALASLSESCKLHLPLLETFMLHLQEQGLSTTECPIT